MRNAGELSLARQAVRAWAARLTFGAVDSTKFVTAASELGRNALVHGGGGSMEMTELMQHGRAGLRLVFQDSGPGIPDIEQALTDGFTTGNSLGLGLGGARRLVDEFGLASTPGEGTRVTVTQWKRR